MKNPLRKRIPRELKSEIGKYLVIFLLMLGTIGMVSGFLVADGSMIKAYNESFEKYNIEDGNFRTGEKVYRGQREAMEEQGIKIYENYYIEEALTNGSTMRFSRTEMKSTKYASWKEDYRKQLEKLRLIVCMPTITASKSETP